jgi:hypothetical protein
LPLLATRRSASPPVMHSTTLPSTLKACSGSANESTVRAGRHQADVHGREDSKDKVPTDGVSEDGIIVRTSLLRSVHDADSATGRK